MNNIKNSIIQDRKNKLNENIEEIEKYIKEVEEFTEKIKDRCDDYEIIKNQVINILTNFKEEYLIHLEELENEYNINKFGIIYIILEQHNKEKKLKFQMKNILNYFYKSYYEFSSFFKD